MSKQTCRLAQYVWTLEPDSLWLLSDSLLSQSDSVAKAFEQILDLCQQKNNSIIHC
jgi:hypothetical protein